jgi:hypothetical protein
VWKTSNKSKGAENCLNDDVEKSSKSITKIDIIRNNLASQTMNIALSLRNQIIETEDIIDNKLNL